tara:strand:+ start:704 stop:1156 length:453 start_codon:yes stop_codon:yes gene_type:complete
MSKSDKIKKLINKYSEDTISEYDTDSNNSNDDPKITENFNNKVLEYIKIDDEIRILSKKTSELKKIKKPLEKYILEYLQQVDEKIIDISNQKTRLRRNKSETRKQLKQDQIKDALLEELGDLKRVENILKSIDSKREKQVHINIKRTMNK